jgi:uncharacterized Fe-S cluster-containing protein
MKLTSLEIYDVTSEYVSVIDGNQGVITFNIEDVSMEVCNDSFDHEFGTEKCDSYFEFGCTLVVDCIEDIELNDNEINSVKDETIKLINELPTGTLYKLFW